MPCKVGSFQTPLATGSQVISGLGFTPKALIVWGQSTAAAPPEFADFAFWNYGMTDGVTQIAMCAAAQDNAATSDTNRAHLEGALIRVINFAASVEVAATLTSFDSGGFTLNYTTVAAQARFCGYLAIGGSGVSAFLGVFDNPISAAPFTQAVTGVGFLPTCVLFAPCVSTATSESADESLCTPAIGWMSPTGQGCSGVFTSDDQLNAITSRIQRTNHALAMISAGSLTHLAERSSFDADGFTVNWTVRTSATPAGIYFLALAGVEARAGSFLQPTATGIQEYSVGFQPDAVLLQSVCDTPQTTLQTQNRYMLGATDGVTQVAVWQGDLDAAPTMINARYYTESAAVALATEAATGTSSTLNAAAAWSAFGASSFSLNWTPVDAVAREVLFLALREQVVEIVPPLTWLPGGRTVGGGGRGGGIASGMTPAEAA